MHNSEYLLEKMKKKGWDDSEIEKARGIFGKNNSSHSIFHPSFDYVLHWILFGMILVLNLSVFFYLLPVFIILNNPISYIFIIILGLGLGAVVDIVIADISHLEKHHHFFISLIIPILTLVLFLHSMYFVQQSFPDYDFFKHPLFLSLSYGISFMLPYYFRKYFKK